MRRRDLLKVFAGGVATWPLEVHAQKTVPVIGYLSSRSADVEGALRTPFLKALAAAGFVVGRDVLIEYRFSDGRQDLLPALAIDLVRQSVSLVVATTGLRRPLRKRRLQQSRPFSPAATIPSVWG